MKKVNITEIDKKDYFEYHIPCGKGLLENSLFYCVVNIQVADDEGYLDYVLIQSKQQLPTEKNANRITQFGEAYESLIKDLDGTFEDWQINFFEEYFEEINKPSIENFAK